MIVVHGTGISHGCTVGGVGAVVAQGSEGGTTAHLAPAAADRRHAVPGPDRCSVVGRACRVRAVGPDLRRVPPMAAGRHLAPDPHPAPVPGRRGGGDRMGPERRLHGVPCPSACGQGSQQGDLQKEPPGGVSDEPCDHGLGRSRGGFTTKLHLAVEQGQKPMSIVVTAGQRGDSPQFEPVLEKVRVPRIGPGRPRVRPDRVRADKAYASRTNRTYLRRRGICTIPDKADQARNRQKLGSRGGRPFAFRCGGLPRAPCAGVRDQPTKKAQGSGHDVRQALRPLRGDGTGRSRERVAGTSTVATALRRRRIRCPRGPAWRRRRGPCPAHP